MSIGKTGIISLNGIESGTKKTMANNSLSSEKKAATTSNKATGKRLR
jgi:hypothetical protein